MLSKLIKFPNPKTMIAFTATTKKCTSRGKSTEAALLEIAGFEELDSGIQAYSDDKHHFDIVTLDQFFKSDSDWPMLVFIDTEGELRNEALELAANLGIHTCFNVKDIKQIRDL